MRTLIVAVIACLVAIASPFAEAAKTKASMVGTWILDPAKSIDKSPTAKQRTSSGVQVGVSGVPLPMPQTESPVVGTPRDPDVIKAQELTIDEIDGAVHLRFPSREVELKPGNEKGVKTQWKGDKLTTSYQTMHRTVSQEYKLTGPNELTVVIRLDPKDQGATTHTRVFTRKVDTPTAEGSEASVTDR